MFREESTYAATRLPVELASTLAPAAYHDPAYHRVEQEMLWRAGWVCVGLVTQVEDVGQTIVREVGGLSVIVTRDAAGGLHAFQNVCRHRGSRLVTHDQTMKAGRIRCPYHAWAYGLDGTLLGTPLFESSDIPLDQRGMFDMADVESFDKADYGLLPVAVAEWGAFVFVDVSAAATPLETWLGDLQDRLSRYDLGSWRVAAAKTYEIAANWKLIAENFMEYYHLPWVHPELVKVSRMEDHHRFQGPGMYTGMTTNPVSQTEDGGWLVLPPYDGLSDEELVSGRFIHVFPNLSISVLPNHMFVMLLFPSGPGHTTEQTYLLTPPATLRDDGTEEALDKLHAFWDHVNMEDVAIVEQVQAGISTTTYPGGRMCYRFEEPLHRFQNMVIDRMVGIDRIPPGDDVDGRAVFGNR